ncbi:MAG: peptidylprolyl isomerase [Bdellovibrionota bacterium]
MKKILYFLILFFVTNAFADNKEDKIIDIVTNRGTIQIELFSQKNTDLVKFFLKYVETGFYNKLIFHRILEGFILQGGAYDVSFKNKEVQLKSQISFKHSEFKNNYGSVGLILRKDNSAITSPQFFINLSDNNYLNSQEGNYEYEVIGKVISGMDIVEKIAHAKIGQREGMYNVPFYPTEALINEVKQF